MTKTRIRQAVLAMFLAAILFTVPSLTQEKKYPFSTFTLENGLQVILSQDFSLPVVSVSVGYRVGPLNEKPGKSGMAFLMENLMFQGSRHIGRMQHINFLNRVGGQFNAVTKADKTIFQQTVPSNHLALALWLESDRMAYLQITRENVEQSKQTLLEDMKYRKAANPYLDSALYFDSRIFSDSLPAFSYESEMRNLTMEDARNFYRSYFQPQNAVLCIVGHIDIQKSTELVRRYFSTLPNSGDIPRPEHSSAEEMTEEIRFSRESLASSPAFFVGYRLSAPDLRDHYPLALIEYLLLKGPTSRLHKRLVQREQLATLVGGGIEVSGRRSVLKIFVVIKEEESRERTLRLVLSEIQKIKTNLVDQEEIDKAKAMLFSDYYDRLASIPRRSQLFTEWVLDGRSLEAIQEYLDNFRSVSAQRLIIIAGRYLKENRMICDIRIK